MRITYKELQRSRYGADGRKKPNLKPTITDNGVELWDGSGISSYIILNEGNTLIVSTCGEWICEGKVRWEESVWIIRDGAFTETIQDELIFKARATDIGRSTINRLPKYKDCRYYILEALT